MTDKSNAPMDLGTAPANGIQTYYKLHGTVGVPLLLLHGVLFDIEQQFGPLPPTPKSCS